PRRHAEAMAEFFDLCDEIAIALHPTPKRFRTHAHDHVIWLGSHDSGHGVANFLPDLLQQGLKRGIVAKTLVTNVNAPEMRRHTGNAHAVKIRLDNGVGTGSKHPKLGSPSQGIGHTGALLSMAGKVDARVRDLA